MENPLDLPKTHANCMRLIQPVTDALYVLNGKWKLPILISLQFGNKRFGQIAKEIPKITDRMLSKELRELEANKLVKRTIHDTFPVTVEYSLTDYGHSLDPVFKALAEWGIQHRERIFKAEKELVEK
ncbi:helix-turn-helix transcriptional regulator [Algoriphagus aestuariicola]|uniref:Helix-turn-helix transcriptional regulator n=1 Tax=Algoriphagus aestuariicola TaxID=1852016 RepID=A0ABS3BLL9_9BACT|nr:helix-turn-helix domain-containing protein [Algoriphagus aestuariicola]MBN7800202.1 helix-turn-helix transcriptional regulator [Algoriphagus aestuariicola]